MPNDGKWYARVMAALLAASFASGPQIAAQDPPPDWREDELWTRASLLPRDASCALLVRDPAALWDVLHGAFPSAESFPEERQWGLDQPLSREARSPLLASFSAERALFYALLFHADTQTLVDDLWPKRLPERRIGDTTAIGATRGSGPQELAKVDERDAFGTYFYFLAEDFVATANAWGEFGELMQGHGSRGTRTPALAAALRDAEPKAPIQFVVALDDLWQELSPSLSLPRLSARADAAAGWKSLAGSADWTEDGLRFAFALSPNDPAKESSPFPFPGLEAEVGGGHPPALSSGSLLTVTLSTPDFTSLYDLWAEALFETQFRRDRLALENSLRALDRSAGFSVREMLLPLIEGPLTLALAPGEESASSPFLWAAATPSGDPALLAALWEEFALLRGAQTATSETGMAATLWSSDAATSRLLTWRQDGTHFVIGNDSEKAGQLFEATRVQTAEANGAPITIHMTWDTARAYRAALALAGRSLDRRRPDEAWRSAGGDAMGTGTLTLTMDSEGDVQARGAVAAPPQAILALMKLPRLRAKWLREDLRLIEGTRTRLETVSEWVKSYADEHGEPPASLDRLLDTGIGFPVADVFSPGGSDPYIYERESPQAWRVWSRGPDGQDDGGARDWSLEGPANGTDLILRGSLRLPGLANDDAASDTANPR
ncbi:MAG: hypothetical protein RLY93_08175 [Sumerlaeia bacterium]